MQALSQDDGILLVNYLMLNKQKQIDESEASDFFDFFFRFFDSRLMKVKLVHILIRLFDSFF